jgi:type II secretory pathway component PulM
VSHPLLARPPVLALVAIVVIVATVLGTIAAGASIARAREDVLRHAAMLDVARARSSEAAAVASPAPPDPDAHANVERVLRAQGIAYRRLPGNAQGDEGQRIVIDAVPFDALVAALDALAREARVRPVEANVDARVEPGVVRAELRLMR